jgi:hypothetical protein
MALHPPDLSVISNWPGTGFEGNFGVSCISRDGCLPEDDDELGPHRSSFNPRRCASEMKKSTAALIHLG